MFDFDKNRVLVIGGTSGIGLSTAHAFASLGASVLVASRSKEKIDQAISLIGAKAEGAQIDVTQWPSVEDFFARHGEFDHVVVSAAQTRVASVRDLSPEDAEAAMNSKFWGAYRVARTARFAPSSSLTLVTGVYGTRPGRNAALQGAINAGLEGLTRGLALELKPVRVNAVSPGLIETPVYKGREAILEKARESIPVGHVGQPQDVAAQIVAIASNPFMTGSVTFVDGGAMIA